MTETASTSEVEAAALWLATGGIDRTKAAVPQIRQRYGLTAAQAVEAIRRAQLIKARAH
ncbi:hypothetical protein [Mesorhizobium australafricanum]|uniref:GcrA cell cycle regulator n=1 Tax=Mesorhizobium australafricanum TaxID=3072311 RepID=A0ABU4WRH8_9HYPH|nr:hypothetical protein [Mesorhizobium sp. VK3E]MDX8438333.1 hypothetical protein [Mesorhizobium sp. VK3E]